MLVLFLLVLFFGSVCCETCSGKPDGHYEISCRTYVSCTSGVPTLVECPVVNNIAYVYDNNTRMCDSPANVGPPCGDLRDCTGKDNKSYPDEYNNCTSYYTCHDEVFFGHQYCNTGLVFDFETQNCNWPTNVKPPCGTNITKLA